MRRPRAAAEHAVEARPEEGRRVALVRERLEDRGTARSSTTSTPTPGRHTRGAGPPAPTPPRSEAAPPPSARTPRPRGTRCAAPAPRAAAARCARTARATIRRVTGASTSDASHPRPRATGGPHRSRARDRHSRPPRRSAHSRRSSPDASRSHRRRRGGRARAARCRTPSRPRRPHRELARVERDRGPALPSARAGRHSSAKRVDEVVAHLEGLEHRLVVLVLVLDHHVVGVPAAPQRLLRGEALGRQAAADALAHVVDVRVGVGRLEQPQLRLAPTARARRRCRCRRTGARSAARRGGSAAARAPPGGRCARDPTRAARGSASAAPSDPRPRAAPAPAASARRASSMAAPIAERKRLV